MTKKSTLVILFYFIFNIQLVQGIDSTSDSVSIKPKYQFQEIVITGEKINDPPFSYSEISADEIDARKLNNIGEALRPISGISLQSTGRKGTSSFYLRGFDQRGVVLLMDGRPIYEPYFGSIDLSQIPAANIAKIKVIKGPASTLYGANSIGGVINFITQNSHLNKTKIGMSYGSGDRYQITGQLGRALGSFDYWISINHYKKNYEVMPGNFEGTFNEDGARRENSDSKGSAIDAKAGWQFSSKGKINIATGYLDSEKGISPSTTSDYPNYWRFTDWKKWYIDMTGDYQFTKKIKMTAKLYQDSYDNTLAAYKDETYGQTKWISNYKNDVYGGFLNFDIALAKHNRLILGVHRKDDKVKIQNNAGGPWEAYNIHTSSFVFQDEYTPFQRFTLLAGASYDLLSGFENWNDSIWGPQAGAVYRVTNNSSIHILIGKKSRFPSLKEWHETTLYGGTSLKPEKAISYDIGIKKSWGTLIFTELNFYHSTVTDLITYQGRNNPFKNLASSRLRGLELDLKFMPYKNLNTRIYYQYLNAIDLDTHQALEFRPEHTLGFTGSLITFYGYKFNISMDVVSKRYYYSSKDRLSLEPYFIAGFNLTKKFMSMFEIWINAKNLLDEFYEDEAGFPLPGREFSTGLVLEF